MKILRTLIPLGLASSLILAADQTKVGAGNFTAEQIGHASPLVNSAYQTLVSKVREISAKQLRTISLDAITNPKTCIAHRADLTEADKDAIIGRLTSEGLVNPADAAVIPGGLKAGIFPPVLHDDTSCPQLPMDYFAAPGSGNNSHHAYPGGLSVHEAFNQQSSINFAATYRGEFGQLNQHGLPVDRSVATPQDTDIRIDQDVILAAPAWHDWAKTMVFQWNADGTEFAELNFGGAGTNDNNGMAGDSRTGGHHIIGIAEAMARGLSPLMVITQASAHSAPTLGNEFKVVNWLRAAAIISRIDPIAKGYLTIDSSGNYRLPPLRRLGDVDLLSQGQSNLLIEYQIHNLSDSDFVNSIPAVTIAQTILQKLAPLFGYNSTDIATYNNRFRNVALSYLSAERIEVLYGKSGVPGVYTELNKLREKGILTDPSKK
jgi:hypothetical protein